MVGMGTESDPWVLRTAPGTSEYTMWRDGDGLVCMVGSTRLTYQGERHRGPARLVGPAGRLARLRAADDQKPAAEGTVEAWGRSESHPVGGRHGARKGYQGWFGMYCRRCLDRVERMIPAHPHDKGSAGQGAEREQRLGPRPAVRDRARRRPLAQRPRQMAAGTRGHSLEGRNAVDWAGPLRSASLCGWPCASMVALMQRISNRR